MPEQACQRCGAPESRVWPGTSGLQPDVCYAAISRGTGEHDWAGLACRDRQLENTQRALASARAQIAHCRVLLARVRDALDVAIEETTPDEPEGDGG